MIGAVIGTLLLPPTRRIDRTINKTIGAVIGKVLLLVATMGSLAASPFAMLDAHSSLRLVTDVVHEDDALCLALTCRAMRDALWARFSTRPAGHAHAGKRLRTRDAAVGRLGSRVSADGMLRLRYDDRDGGDLRYDDSDDGNGLMILPERIGRLAYLRRPGLKRLDLCHNKQLMELPEGLCALAGLEELNLNGCGLTVLPEGIGGLTALKKLNLFNNGGLTALPEGLWLLAGLEELDLMAMKL
jgi:hypothetical protein